MYQYRAYVKDVLNLDDKPKCFLTVISFTIRRDLLTNATSDFTVLNASQNIDNGDVFCLYNPNGKVIYQGVINQIEENNIQCIQMSSLLKGQFVYNTAPQASLEKEVEMLLSYYVKAWYDEFERDNLFSNKFRSFAFESKGTTNLHLPTKEPKTVIDMEAFIYDLYAKYGLMVNFVINYQGQNKIIVETPKMSAHKVANNNNSIRNMLPITEVAETNKLVVYNSKSEFRGAYYVTQDGITTNANDPLRKKVINEKILFSDDDLNTLVASTLPKQLYNHKLEFDLLLKSNIYKWDDWKLGQPLDIHMNDKYFKSIYTGYELVKTENSEPIMVHIICGMVRTSLTKKLLLRGVI